MHDLIVVAGATHREGFLDEYEKQLADARIEFFLWPLEHLPAGANSITMSKRIDYMRQVCSKYRDYAKIVLTDAWDVLSYASKDELMHKIPETMIVSAERNCYPEPDLTPLFTSTSPWRFANNGCLAGSPSFILTWLDWAERIGQLGILDQAWFNRRVSEGEPSIMLDENTDLFYVVSSTQEDGALKTKSGRPWNSRYDSYPCFLHFSGKCPDDRFRALMRGEIESI